jgi:hypothetical protein
MTSRKSPNNPPQDDSYWSQRGTASPSAALRIVPRKTPSQAMRPAFTAAPPTALEEARCPSQSHPTVRLASLVERLRQVVVQTW